MRTFLILIPAVLLAQTPAPQGAAKSAPAAKSTAVKSTTAAKSTTAPSAAATGMTDDQKTIYAVGLSIYKNISGFSFTPAELDLIKKAISDAAAGKPALDLDAQGPKIQPLFEARAKAAGAAYLAKAAAQPGAVKTASGLVYRDQRVGTGPSPKATDKVKVNYRGTFIDGKEFDSSYKTGMPASLGLTMVIPCWTEGVQKMKVGGKASLVCPYQIAYGENGRSGIPAFATLAFEIELVSIEK